MQNFNIYTNIAFYELLRAPNQLLKMELESTIHNLLSTLRPDKHQTLPPKPFILH